MSDVIRKIIHVAMDAFYASVEQRDNPELRGKPVAVGHGARRGVVAAASYEARAFGLRSTLPSVTALRKCPELVFVPPRFDVYRAVSKQIHAIFAAFTDLVEPLALDEAYLDVTANKAGQETAWQTAMLIRARILEETGLTASAGVSYNKFLAKLASGRRKPNGQFAIQPHEGEAFVEALPVAKFHGVGPATAEKMHRPGIETGADLKAWSLQDLQARFGKSGPWYYGIARGEDHRAVNPNRERKSLGSETTLDHDHRAGADRGGCPYDGRRRLGLVREDRPARPHRDGQGQMGGLPAVHPKPLLSGPDRQPRQAPRSQPGPHPSVFPPAKGVRLVGVTLSNFSAAAGSVTANPTLMPESDAA